MICFSFFSCEKPKLNGNGNVVIETRNLTAFKRIYTSGSTPIFVSYGSEYSVRLEGSANLIDRYQTIVSDNELSLGYEFTRLGNDDVKIYVTLPSLEEITLSGSAKIEVIGTFSPQEYFSADISGTGDIELLGNMASEQTKVNISGAGDALLGALKSKNAVLVVSGKGNVKNSVTGHLKAVISGSGNIFYIGSPTIEYSISGSGKLMKNLQPIANK